MPFASVIEYCCHSTNVVCGVELAQDLRIMIIVIIVIILWFLCGHNLTALCTSTEHSRLLLDVHNLSLGRRHLVNTYEVKAGIGVIAGNTVWSVPERLECEVLHKVHYINILTFLPSAVVLAQRCSVYVNIHIVFDPKCMNHPLQRAARHLWVVALVGGVWQPNKGDWQPELQSNTVSFVDFVHLLLNSHSVLSCL